MLQSRDLNGSADTGVFEIGDGKPHGLKWLPDGRFIYGTQEQAAIAATCNFWEMQLDRERQADREAKKTHELGGVLHDHAGVTANSKRLAFLKWQVHTSIYVADLDTHGSRMGSQLTLADGKS